MQGTVEFHVNPMSTQEIPEIPKAREARGSGAAGGVAGKAPVAVCELLF